MPIIIFSICFFILCFFLFKFYIKIAEKLNIIDFPNKLSNHKMKIPTGIGIIFVGLIIFIYLFLIIISFYQILDINFPNRHYLFCFSILILGVISFFDDVKNIHPIYRFFSHIVMVMLSVPLFTFDIYYLIPEKLTFVIIVFLWVYIINMFNFLDGSNGYLSINSLFIFIGYLLTLYIDGNQIYNFKFLIILFTSIILLIYLYFNFPTARVFCGDSGSITIGYIVGYILLDLIFGDYWFIAISLISYPFFDVSITIIKKMKNGKYPWERLFDYFFLRALNSIKKNHSKIFLISLTYNIINFTVVVIMLILNIKYLFILSVIFALTKLYIFENISRRKLIF